MNHSDPVTPNDTAALAANAIPHPQARLSPVVILGLFALGGLLALAALRTVFIAQQIPELTESTLEKAEQKWNDGGPASYDLDVVIRGAQPGTVHLEVRNGKTIAMQRDGITPKQQRTWDVWSVPGQFDMIERELEMAADPEHEMQAAAGTQLRLRCEFDDRYGFPRQFHRVAYGGGTEVYWHVTNFQSQ